MTISIWRYSHLALAISSFFLLILASVTGIILAFEPVSADLQPYRVKHFDELRLAETLPVLRTAYPGITELSVNSQGFVHIKGSDDEGQELTAYVDPRNGRVLGKPAPQSAFFQWVTALHRSLFLHETGRFFIGLTSFLLLLITISGTILLIQRQRGVRRFFSRIAKDDSAQYYHVVLGRLSLIPIILLALSGTYLSLVRFELIDVSKHSPEVDFDAIKSAPLRETSQFEIFKTTKLSAVESIAFPFSTDVEDYYTLKLKTAEIAVNQVTGEVLARTDYPRAVSFTNLSLDLHTGRANSVWAIVLAIASVNILVFIYTGFAITLKRRSSRIKNRFTARESKFVILVGSENGSTFRFAKTIHNQLLKAGEKSFISEMNNYGAFPKATHLIVVTATYGLGDPPTSAAKFKAMVEEYPQQQSIHYSVLGFGSKAYPEFCKFAYDVNYLLSAQAWALPATDIHTVNDKSPQEFSLWAEAWSQQSGVQVTVAPECYSGYAGKMEKLQTRSNYPETTLPGESFTVSLKMRKRLPVKSGDLMAIYPLNDHRERLYSIGVIDGEIRLNVKLHEGGIGSSFLRQLKVGQMLKARIIVNKHFHFPKGAPEVLMISNGTGIAPFLGMINENSKHKPCHLYCGFREHASYERYRAYLDDNKVQSKLLSLYPAFSRETTKQYVSDLIERDADFIANLLKRGGVIMICGSLAMLKDVMDILEGICQSQTGKGISFYQSHNQVLTDCY
jgi:sulfite reductase (NADPH) flavoprotein alpha-component